jgi:hypothetical protein
MHSDALSRDGKRAWGLAALAGAGDDKPAEARAHESAAWD